MSAGPVIPMVWEGPHIVRTVRNMMGVTDPADCAPGTIRGELSITVSLCIIFVNICLLHESRLLILALSSKVK